MAPELRYSVPGSLSMIPIVGTLRWITRTDLLDEEDEAPPLLTLAESKWEASI